MRSKKVAVIGSGFSGLASACFLAKAGYDVTIFEKNESPGGRARKFEAEGFLFDMGPSWYWMPDVFQKFFGHFDKQVSDFYDLVRLDPSYRVYFSAKDFIDLPAGIDGLVEMFDSIEPGSGDGLNKILAEGRYKYQVGINNLVYKPGLEFSELFDAQLLSGVFKLHAFQSVSSYIRKYVKNPRLIQLLEFPVLFLGASPQKTPALYSLMNYADMALGTWYPMGGMHKIVEGITSLALSLGVKFEFGSEVEKIIVQRTSATGLQINGEEKKFDYIVASADYNHVEQNLIPLSHRRYSSRYWKERAMAPSSLIFYIGLSKKLKNLLHHNLFFDKDFATHIKELYDEPQWPTDPLFYVCCPSKTDSGVAPLGCENLFILIPVAPGLNDLKETREKYFNNVIDRLESITGEEIRNHITYNRSYAHRDFISDYHAFRGNAFGLANTLMQTAHLRPSMINKRVTNLFYTGQLTVPGPGVPPSLISGQLAAEQLIRKDKKLVRQE